MTSISFSVDGAPVPWSRAGQNGKYKFTPAHVRKYQNWVKDCASKAMEGRDPILCPVKLAFTAVLPIPTSFPNWKKDAAHAGFVRPATKPDVDNLEKMIADSCNEIVWKDDRQVCVTHGAKIYGAKPRLDVVIEPLQHIASAQEWKEHVATSVG